MTSLVEPLTPSECDLSDFASMFFDVRRLLSSETWIEAAEHPRLGHALMCLWMESWHQRPAASLPDNDSVLARFAMCDLKTWKKLRDVALKGWVKCSDGRFYHPVVAEKALAAWLEKLVQRRKSGAGNAKRWQIEFDSTQIDADIERATGMLKAINPQSHVFSKRGSLVMPKDSKSDPTGMQQGVPEDIPQGFPEGSQGRGIGKGIGRERGKDIPPDGGVTPPAASPRATRLPKTATLPDEWRDWAQDHCPSWTSGHITGIFDSFRDYWVGKSGKDAAKNDWFATWRNWCRREAQALRRGGNVTDFRAVRQREQDAVWEEFMNRNQDADTSYIDGEFTHG